MASRYASSAFDEMPALKVQWDATLKANAEDRKTFPGVDSRIAKELIQYFTIEPLAMTLSDYYERLDESVTRRDPLVTYQREQLPSFRLENRLLELFSREMKDRTGFDLEDADPERDATVYSSFTDRRYFSRFELTVPKSCRISVQDGAVVITGPNLRVEIACDCPGYNRSVPYEYARHVLGVKNPFDMDDYEVRTTITTRLSRRLFFGKRQQLRDGWVEEFVDSMMRRADWDEHLTSIQWNLVETMISVWKPGSSHGGLAN